MATFVTWSEVKAIDSTLSAVDLDAQTMILAFANNALIPSLFGGEASPKLRLARIYIAAHFGALSLQGSGKWTGQVISESALGIARSYQSNSPNGTNPLWDKTPHGQAYRTLVRTSRARGPVVC